MGMTRFRCAGRSGARSGFHSERGAAAVEFALLLPLFLTLVLGAIDWGYYFFVDLIATNAAREGARAGSVVNPGMGNWPTARAQAEAAARGYLSRAGFMPSGVTASLTAAGGVPAVQLDIAFPVGRGGSITGFLQPFLPDEARATAVMRWE
jgi:Flp pilus assembly protein TadG